ncbi:non-homologous end-joining DNA ligase [Actinomycetospora rhizophila]|uniref:DNA ligase (ATP) n=1 Tax=Actinomycetospora rhizophila TaxID=1416876 RepID=A0ABV9ZNK7_9PSEU
MPDDVWDLPAEQQRALRKADGVGFRTPMLATLSKEHPPGAGWVFERKLDGVRVIATRERGGTPRLWSRNQKPMDASYPEIVEALAEHGPAQFVLDGEITAADGTFSSLQARMHLQDPNRARRTGVEVEAHLFDLLVLDAIDVTRLPQSTRHRILDAVVTFSAPLFRSPALSGDPSDLLAEACAGGWEGLIAKRSDAPYVVGGRSRDWLKLKCVRDQEFVIGGWTDPSGSRRGLGALLVGYWAAGELRYAGKVGTGYDAAALTMLRDRLDPLAVDESPFVDAVREKGQHWVRPELVCAVGFGEWTTDGRLRHPRYQGLREDKDPADVVREQ